MHFCPLIQNTNSNLFPWEGDSELKKRNHEDVCSWMPTIMWVTVGVGALAEHAAVRGNSESQTSMARLLTLASETWVHAVCPTVTPALISAVCACLWVCMYEREPAGGVTLIASSVNVCILAAAWPTSLLPPTVTLLACVTILGGWVVAWAVSANQTAGQGRGGGYRKLAGPPGWGFQGVEPTRTAPVWKWMACELSCRNTGLCICVV